MTTIVIVIAVVWLALLAVAAVGRTSPNKGNALYRRSQFVALLVLGGIGLVALVVWGLASL